MGMWYLALHSKNETLNISNMSDEMTLLENGRIKSLVNFIQTDGKEPVPIKREGIALVRGNGGQG